MNKIPNSPTIKSQNPSELLVDFGLQPVSNRFMPADGTSSAPRYPLQLSIESATGLIYLATPFPVEELKPRYDWLTCYEPEDHLDRLVDTLIRLPNVSKDSVFGGYSFKDDSTLDRLTQRGYKNTWRIDPNGDLGISDPCANVETYQLAFTPGRGTEIQRRRGAADVFIVRHVVEHAYDMPLFVAAIRRMVKPGGYIVWELPDCERALASGDCTSVWEEHVYYFTSFTFRKCLVSHGFSVVHSESVPYPLENSLVVVVKDSEVTDAGTAVDDSREIATELDRARKFATSLRDRKALIRNQLNLIRDRRGPIALFGAGHLSVAFLSLMEVENLISFVVDDNPHKIGLKMPIGGLRIVGSEYLCSGEVRVCLLGLNPQNQAKVIRNNQSFLKIGGTFASIFPCGKPSLESLL